VCIGVRSTTFAAIFVAEDCVVPPKHEPNVQVRISDDGIPHPPSNWAIEPRILEPRVMAARTLFSDSHKKPVVHVCNYSKKFDTFKADSFLGLAELVVHIVVDTSPGLRVGATDLFSREALILAAWPISDSSEMDHVTTPLQRQAISAHLASRLSEP